MKKKYFKNMWEAKKAYKARFGCDYGNDSFSGNGETAIFRLKDGRNKGKVFMGTYTEWLNLP